MSFADLITHMGEEAAGAWCMQQQLSVTPEKRFAVAMSIYATVLYSAMYRTDTQIPVDEKYVLRMVADEVKANRHQALENAKAIVER